MSEEKLKGVVQAAFDEASAGYDRPAMRFFDKSANNLVRRLSLKGNEHVLDVATGTGKIAVALARRLKEGRVTGVDLSPGMLSVAEQKVSRANLNNVTFQRSDVDAVEFPPEHFDGLTCGFGVHFWSIMEKSLSRLVGMVKSGGFVAITSFAKGSFDPHSSLCLKQFSHYGVQLPDSYSLERLDQPEKNIALFENVGIRNVTFEKTQAGYYLESAQDWWDLVLFTGYRAFLNQLTAEKAPQFKEEFLSAVDATKDAQGIFLNVEVITTIGTVKR